MTPPDRELERALWRYGIISPLLHRTADNPPLCQMIANLAEKSFIRPSGAPARYSPETLRKWLYNYRHRGLDGLYNRPRANKGTVQVPKALVDATAALRDKHPQWTMAKILEKLLASGAWNGRRPSRATMYRMASVHRLKRLSSQEADDSCRAFAFTAFGQLWLADFMHGPRLRRGRRLKKAILHAIIDDATRYVVAARFDWHENAQVLMREMMGAVGRFGICQRFYTDNGPSYASSLLKQVCARLGIQLVHTPPYRPQGRGKVERWFLTVRQQFLSDQHAASLERLNEDLAQYLAEYHHRIHRSLGASPLQKRLAGENRCRKLPEVADIQWLFAAEKKARVYNDGTIQLNTRRFEVPGCLPGSRVPVRYLPWDPDWVYYGDDPQPARPLNPVQNAQRFNHPKGGRR
jgi:transposase InsO family protein